MNFWPTLISLVRVGGRVCEPCAVFDKKFDNRLLVDIYRYKYSEPGEVYVGSLVVMKNVLSILTI